MKGLLQIRQFYEQYAVPMLQRGFGAYLDSMAIGLAGHGSECFGYDDEVSVDHDYDTGFYIWLPDDVYDAIGADLQYAYLHLPHLRAQNTASGFSRGVVRISDFYRPYLGSDALPMGNFDWLRLDTTMLAEATNGAVFFDGLGQFSHIRTTLLRMPRDVLLQKTAAHLLLAAQAGQYNFARSIQHGEEGAAVLALHEFVGHVSNAIFLLCERYAPYYKWTLRAMRDLPFMAEAEPILTDLLCSEHRASTLGEDTARIETVCAIVKKRLVELGLSVAPDDYLAPHAYQIRRHIADPEVRALHPMAGI